MKSFGQRLINLRKEKNLTQEELGKLLNITGQGISKYETNQSLPDLDMIVRISEVFNVSCDYLCGIEPKVEVRENIDINKLILKVILESKKEVIKVNLPLTIIIYLVKVNASMPVINNSNILNEIKWDEIIEMIKLGTIGQIVEVDSGDEHIRIIIE